MTTENVTAHDLAEQMSAMNVEIDTFYLLICGCLVMIMQAGFAMLEAGSIRSINVRNVLFKNIADACIGGVIFYLFGFGLAYGGSEDGGFAGSSKGDGKYSFAFRVDDSGDSASKGYAWISYFFQWCFAAAATTIVSGGVTGRIRLSAYLAYSVLLTGFVYPVIVHWVWDTEGWISAFNEDHLNGGMIDFAGSGVVHMTGGVAALVGAVAAGARIGRFDDAPDGDHSFKQHSAPLQVLGTFLLWFGWYGFNCGSTLAIVGQGETAARVAVTTTLAAVGGATGSLLLVKTVDGQWDVGAMCNGLLAGLVSITAGCATVEVWAALLIGTLGGFVVVGVSKLLEEYFKVDDPLDAFAVHGACGAWGCIAVGLFTTEDYGFNMDGNYGLFYSGDFHLLGVQLLGVVVQIAWVTLTTGLLFGTLAYFGVLRVAEDEEMAGLDIIEHEGPAYVIVSRTGGPPSPTKKKKHSSAVVVAKDMTEP